MNTTLKAAGGVLICAGVFLLTGIAFALLMQGPDGIGSTFVHAFKLVEALGVLAVCVSMLWWLYRRRR